MRRHRHRLCIQHASVFHVLYSSPPVSVSSRHAVGHACYGSHSLYLYVDSVYHTILRPALPSALSYAMLRCHYGILLVIDFKNGSSVVKSTSKFNSVARTYPSIRETQEETWAEEAAE